jgi:hypothetical protein
MQRALLLSVAAGLAGFWGLAQDPEPPKPFTPQDQHQTMVEHMRREAMRTGQTPRTGVNPQAALDYQRLKADLSRELRLELRADLKREIIQEIRQELRQEIRSEVMSEIQRQR